VADRLHPAPRLVVGQVVLQRDGGAETIEGRVVLAAAIGDLDELALAGDDDDAATWRRIMAAVTQFAADSPLEGTGFEPSVPGTKEPVFVAEGELRNRTGAAKKGCFLCGTDGSNPSPSSGESQENRVLAGVGPA
jgi:hypothetical protein